MNEMDRKRIRRIIEQVAAEEGTSIGEVRKEMQLAIDDAFSQRYEFGHEAFIRTFGDRCPSVEEFILKTAAISASLE